MKYILAGIDGTGSRTWMPQAGGSAVRRFVDDFDPQRGAKRYFPGPDSEATGYDTPAIVRAVRDFIYGAYLAATDVQLPWAGPADLPPAERARVIRQTIHTIDSRVLKIILVGHSRGGLVAIETARILLAPIAFLGLFDAVDRTAGIDGGRIRNVQITYHALRHPAIGSRPSFGNTGLSSNGRYLERRFWTSHGGVGGAYEPNPSGPTADYSCSADYELEHAHDTRGRRATNLGSRAALCARESRSAESWMRDSARKFGLQFRGR